jgi:hypothetical protein
MKKKKEKDAAEEKIHAQEELLQAEEEESGSAKEMAFSKMKEDISLFHSLWPDVDADEIPQEVWARVEKGESLSASFALYMLMQEKEAEHIQKINEENEKKAPPKIKSDGTESDYFSPEAVKNMSRSEIKKNYNKILSSMEQWN